MPVVRALLFSLALAAAMPVLPAPLADIVIGQVADQSGESADVSRDYVAGARTYFDAVNARGGVRGRRIVLLVRDDGGDPARSSALSRELVDRDRVLALFGQVGDTPVAAVAKSEAFRRGGVALFAPLAGIDAGASGDQLFFVRPTYETEAARIVEWFRGLGMTRVALVRGKSDYGTSLRRAVGERLRESGVEIVTDATLDGDGRDALNVAQHVAAAGPQFVLALADTITVGHFIRAFRPLASGTFVVGLSNISHQTLLEFAGARLATGTLLTQVVPNPSRANSGVVREHLALMKQFRDEPPSHLTLEGFIAAKALVAVMRSIDGDINRTSVLAALRARRALDLDGFTLSFAENSNRGSRFADLTLLRKDGTLLQ